MAGFFRTAAEIISDAAIQLGVESEAMTEPIESGNKAVLQLVGFFNAEGRRLSRKYDWSSLIGEYTFATVPSTASYRLPGSDADNLWAQRLIDGSFWDRTNQRQLTGPLSPKDWQALKGQSVSSLTNTAFRVWGEMLWLYPTPTDVRTIAYEFVWRTWMRDVGSVAGDGPVWDAYTATTTGGIFPLIDADLMTAATKLAYLKARGYPSQDAQDEYQTALDEARGADGAAPIVDIVPGSSRPQFNPPGDDGTWGV